MKLHGSAALSQRQRRRLVVLVGSGMTIAAAAAIVGCSRQTGSKWVNRHRRGEGLEDRSSRPHRSPRRVADVVEEAVLRARAELRAGPHVIGWSTGIAASTVHAILRRHGCSRLKPRLPRGEIVRYERERPGELVHVDVKKLGRIVKPSHRVTGDRRDRSRGAGWQYLFVAIDDATRLGFGRLYTDETGQCVKGASPLVLVSVSAGVGLATVLSSWRVLGQGGRIEQDFRDWEHVIDADRPSRLRDCRPGRLPQRQRLECGRSELSVLLAETIR